MDLPEYINVEGTYYVLAEDGGDGGEISSPNEDLEQPDTKTQKTDEASDKEKKKEKDAEEGPWDSMSQPCGDHVEKSVSPAKHVARVIHYKGERYELVEAANNPKVLKAAHKALNVIANKLLETCRSGQDPKAKKQACDDYDMTDRISTELGNSFNSLDDGLQRQVVQALETGAADPGKAYQAMSMVDKIFKSQY